MSFDEANFCCLYMNMNMNANMSINSCCWCLLFVVVLLISLFFACNFLFVFLESLILAQDERWRRA